MKRGKKYLRKGAQVFFNGSLISLCSMSNIYIKVQLSFLKIDGVLVGNEIVPKKRQNHYI